MAVLSVIVNRIKRLREDGTRSSSQSRQDKVEDSQRLSTATRRSRSRSRERHSHNQSRSAVEMSSTLRSTRPYAAGLAAQLSQRRKQLEARAKEKLKMEKENLAKSPAVDTDSVKVESPAVKRANERKVVIEIQDDDEQNVTDCQTEASVDLANSLPPESVKTDDTSVKDDGDNTSTTDSTPLRSSDGSTVLNDKCDAGQTSESQQTGTASPAAATKCTSATLSLMNLPMPPVTSESDSEVTPASTEEL